jgi:hypothetical protein
VTTKAREDAHLEAAEDAEKLFVMSSSSCAWSECPCCTSQNNAEAGLSTDNGFPGAKGAQRQETQPKKQLPNKTNSAFISKSHLAREY